MTIRHCALLLCFLLATAYKGRAQNYQDVNPEPGKFYLLGTYAQPVAGKSGWCADKTYELIALASAAEYDTARRAFYERHKKADPDTRLLTPKESFVVYSATKDFVEFNCKYQFIGLIKAPTLDSARKKMNMLSQEHKTITWVRELVGVENKANGDNTVSENLDGVEVVRTVRKRNDGKPPIVLLRFNNYSGLVANVIVAKEGKILSQEKIPHTQSYQLILKDDDPFTYDIRFEKPNFNDQLDEKLQALLKKTIIKIVGEKKPVKKKETTPPGSIGVRG